MLGYTLRKLYRPEIFQGHNKKINYFEGWYFKLVDKKSVNIYAVIPDIVKLMEKSKHNNMVELVFDDTGYYGGLEIINPEVLLSQDNRL